MTEIIELEGDGFKTRITNMLHIVKKGEENMNMTGGEIQNTKRPN